MEFNRHAAPERLAAVGEALGAKPDGRAAVERVSDLNERIGIPPRLGPLGVTAEHVPLMAKDAMLSGNILVNPRPTQQADIEALYRAAL